MMKHTCLLLMVIVCLFVASCNKQAREHLPKKNVLIVHSVDDNTGSYTQLAKNAYSKAWLKQQNVNADVRHIFLPYPMADESKELNVLIQDLQQLRQDDWTPDILLVQNDPALNAYLTYLKEEPTSQLADKPVVYAGITFADKKLQDEAYRKLDITGYHDSIDIKANLDLFREMWGKKSVCLLEMDDMQRQLPIFDMITEAISDTAEYVNNMDWHIPELDENELLQPNHGEKTIVHFFSSQRPLENTRMDDPNMDPIMARSIAGNNLRNVFWLASKLHTIQIWYDSNSNSIIDHGQMPQLSIINAQFGDEYPVRILGGVFCDIDTQAEDAVGMAVEILQGKSARSIEPRMHANKLHLDWRAMQRYGISYSKWKDKAHIINAPQKETNPIMYYTNMMLLGVCASALLILISWMVMSKFYNKRLFRRLQEERNMEWMMGGFQYAIWHLSDNVFTYENQDAKQLGFIRNALTREEIMRYLQPEYRDAINNIYEMNLAEGRHEIRFQMSLDGGKSVHWFSIMFFVTQQNKITRTLEGIMRNIDQDIANEKDMLHEVDVAEETKVKEAFLANVTHDLRSPLSSIVSFAELITDQSGNYSAEEQKMMVEQIQVNTDLMLHLLDDVVDTSRLQMSEYRYMKKDVSVQQLMEQIYNSGKVLVPNHLYFNLQKDSDATIYVDAARITQVMNNLLSNAIKATTEGGIVMGWKVTPETVRLYVQDTGCGISEERLPQLFTKYYKFDGKTSGAGLGLNICKTMVEGQGGSIHVESVLGKGTTFYAEWPNNNARKEEAS